jgi:hypothetical protein
MSNRSLETSVCWICGDKADSREHKAKRSDLKAVFGTVNQSKPLYLHQDDIKNCLVKGLKSDLLKWPKTMCTKCNGSRTQPFDKSWETLSRALRSRSGLQPGDTIRGKWAFPYDTRCNMRNVHMYFVKAFGCVIRSAPADVPTRIGLIEFSKAIMLGRCHPDIYLKFGMSEKPDEQARVEGSDLDVYWNTETGRCDLATWFYNVNGLVVLVSYAPDNKVFIRENSFWHPKMGTNKLSYGFEG